jgi:membrane protein required for colicin V production
VTWLDFTFIAVVALSTLISLVRGIVKEVLSLAAWVVAFGVAWYYANGIANVFAAYLHVAWLRYVLSFLSILLVTLLLTSMLSRFIGMAIKSSGMGMSDRLMGMVFGFARGIVVVALLTVMISAMPVREEPWWKESMLMPYFLGATQWLMNRVPQAEIHKAIEDFGGR